MYYLPPHTQYQECQVTNGTAAATATMVEEMIIATNVMVVDHMEEEVIAMAVDMVEDLMIDMEAATVTIGRIISVFN